MIILTILSKALSNLGQFSTLFSLFILRFESIEDWSMFRYGKISWETSDSQKGNTRKLCSDMKIEKVLFGIYKQKNIYFNFHKHYVLFLNLLARYNSISKYIEKNMYNLYVKFYMYN